MNREELAWCAGILEGEGCFSVQHLTSSGGVPYVGISVLCQMTDEDVINRLQVLIGGTISTHQKKKRSPTGRLPKLQYRVTVGRRQGCEKLMRDLLPLMGERRSQKIKEVLKLGEEFPPRDSTRKAWSNEDTYS